jgi:hypothetical protein
MRCVFAAFMEPDEVSRPGRHQLDLALREQRLEAQTPSRSSRGSETRSRANSGMADSGNDWRVT